jgi:hypothetical protein
VDLSPFLNLLAIAASWIAEHWRPLAVGAVAVVILSFVFARREPD